MEEKNNITEITGIIESCKGDSDRTSYFHMSFLEDSMNALLSIEYRFEDSYNGERIYNSLDMRVKHESKCKAKLRIKGKLEDDKIEYEGVGLIKFLDKIQDK